MKILAVYEDKHSNAPEAFFDDEVLAKAYLNRLIEENEFEHGFGKNEPYLAEVELNPSPPDIYFRHRAYVLLNDELLVPHHGTPHGQTSHYVRWEGPAQYSVHSFGNDNDGLIWVQADSPIDFSHAANIARTAAQRYLREPFAQYTNFNEDHTPVENTDPAELDLGSL